MPSSCLWDFPGKNTGGNGVAISFSRGSSQSMDQTLASCVGWWILLPLSHPGSQHTYASRQSLNASLFTCGLSGSALVAVTKLHGLCVLNSREVLLSSAGWKSKINLPVDSVPGENYLPGWGSDFLLCLPSHGR